jgi:hypothetical protein
MSVSALPLVPRIARAAWVIGFVAAGLAVAGSLIAQGPVALAILRIGVWLAAGFGVLGLVTGLLSRSHPAGRRAVIASAALLVIVAVFIVWSAPVAVSTAPAAG